VARYVTEVVESPVAETTVTSGAAPVPVELTLPEAGVYVVELEASDRPRARADGRGGLLRRRRAAGDLGASRLAGLSRSFPDAAKYKPGERARLVLESPFQTGQALVAVEAPEGNRYSWLPVAGGKAVLRAADRRALDAAPAGALPAAARAPARHPAAARQLDRPRPPRGLRATVWLEVEPVALRVDVALDYPQRARPGQRIEVGIRLADPHGAPLPGQVTLWLVDQAVLALGREQRLDPVPSFLTAMRSLLTARDTRSLVFGFLPFARQPGGGEGEEAAGLLDRQTIRKNFQPVPFYDPAIAVGPDGVAKVAVTLPDDLTNFKVRAKVAAGDERFGFATGELEVRQPVVVQPSLPRFVRPGDEFVATAVGRVVEGEGAPARRRRASRA